MSSSLSEHQMQSDLAAIDGHAENLYTLNTPEQQDYDSLELICGQRVYFALTSQNEHSYLHLLAPDNSPLGGRSGFSLVIELDKNFVKPGPLLFSLTAKHTGGVCGFQGWSTIAFEQAPF